MKAIEQPISVPTTYAGPFSLPPEYAELRAAAPLARLSYPNGRVGWLVTSHELARAILTDDRISMHPILPMPHPGAQSFAEVRTALDGDAIFSANPIDMDPPDHTRLRRILTKHYTNASVGDYRATIEAAVTETLDAMEAAGPPAELLGDFALPVVSATGATVFGISREQSDGIVRLANVAFDLSAAVEDSARAFREVKDFVGGLVERKRREPGDDVISSLIATGQLGDDEIVSATVILAISGHDTTANMIAASAFALLCHPQQMQALQADPALIEGAVDEFLRYATLFKTAFTRTAREDIEIGGQVIAAGESVTVALAAVNRDPDKYPEPDELDVRRNARGHHAFGHGIHICLGQHLARLEMRIAVAGLIERFPSLRLAVPAGQVPMEGGEHPLNAVRELPVAW